MAHLHDANVCNMKTGATKWIIRYKRSLFEGPGAGSKRVVGVGYECRWRICTIQPYRLWNRARLRKPMAH